VPAKTNAWRMNESGYIDKCLEADTIFGEEAKVRHIGGNLRRYPLMIACARKDCSQVLRFPI
jgi:hypothetical protein